MKNANPLSQLHRGLLLLALAVAVLAGCQRSDAPASAPKSVMDFFEMKVGGQTVRLQFAVHPAEMERGLMERRDLGPSEGMLFVYDRPQRMSFWMRSTPTPLDIGFFNEAGTLEEIYALQPFDETPVQSRGSRFVLALEMHQGWFRDHGVRPGAQIDRAAVRAALNARGFDPAAFRWLR